MGLTVNGDSIVISDANIEIVNGANEESGVAYIIITPSGGVGSLPFMSTGAPGQPTLFPEISVVEVPYEDPLPIRNPLSILKDAGGPGLPAKYSLTFYVHAGPQGIDGTSTISGATDLSTTPGSGTDGFTLIYRNSDSKWVPTAPKVGASYSPASIASTADNSTGVRLLSSQAIAAQPFDWHPRVYASTIVTGSDGAQPTRVDLFARLNDPASGTLLGYARGLIGANAAEMQTVLLPGSDGVVSAGAAATIHLRAEQVATSSSNWSTPASPITVFTVEVEPL